MRTATNCEKCIFADYGDASEPCAIGIIQRIRNSKTIDITDNKFNKIHDYRCAFAFSTEIYKKHIEEIKSIEELKQQLYNRAKINYYMVIILKDTSLVKKVCLALQDMAIKPKFVSLCVEKNNETSIILDLLKTLMPNSIKWKLHNFLGNYDFQESLDTIFETNTNKDNTTYFWVNDTDSIDSWVENINKINDIIVIDQPFLHAMFRKNKDGLFLTFNNYQEILNIYKTNILDSLDKIENVSIIYYE